MGSEVRMWAGILWLEGGLSAAKSADLLEGIADGELTDQLEGVKFKGSTEEIEDMCWEVYDYLLSRGHLYD